MPMGREHKGMSFSAILEDHCLDALGGGIILYHRVDHLAVLIDGHDRQTQHLLADGQTAGLWWFREQNFILSPYFSEYSCT